MDSKEKSLINYYHRKFIDNTFDEKDVYAFLILCRNRSEDNSCLHELADFIAHRDTNQGFIKDYLEETRHKFEKLGKMKPAIRIEDVFSFREIKNGVNNVLADCGLNGFANEKINDFVTCLISILQQVKVTDNGRDIGKLFFAISNKQIILMAEVEIVQTEKKTNAVFPVLTANNSYAPLKKQDKFDTPYFFADDVIEITNLVGKLEITIATN